MTTDVRAGISLPTARHPRRDALNVDTDCTLRRGARRVALRAGTDCRHLRPRRTRSDRVRPANCPGHSPPVARCSSSVLRSSSSVLRCSPSALRSPPSGGLLAVVAAVDCGALREDGAVRHSPYRLAIRGELQCPTPLVQQMMMLVARRDQVLLIGGAVVSAPEDDVMYPTPRQRHQTRPQRARCVHRSQPRPLLGRRRANAATHIRQPCITAGRIPASQAIRRTVSTGISTPSTVSHSPASERPVAEKVPVDAHDQLGSRRRSVAKRADRGDEGVDLQLHVGHRPITGLLIARSQPGLLGLQATIDDRTAHRVPRSDATCRCWNR